jgi:hypothetical protein
MPETIAGKGMQVEIDGGIGRENRNFGYGGHACQLS